MKRFLRYTGFGLLGLLGVAVLFVGAAYALSAARLAKTYPTTVSAVAMRTDPAAVADGRHITEIRGCNDCHGADYGGKVMIDDAMLGRVVAANLTPGGRVGTWTDADFTRAIRQGIAPDGKPLLIMPSHEYRHLSDADVGALIAFLRSLPAVRRALPEHHVGPLGRILHVTGGAPLVAAELLAEAEVNGQAPHAGPAEPGPTAAYGAYLATSCLGCHGDDYSGKTIVGAPPGTPPAANLTPDRATGLGAWDEADFKTLLRSGTRPDGSKVHPFMPIAMTSKLTDEEVAALWAYFSSLKPVNAPGR